MANEVPLPTTQRAYTLRLRGNDEDDRSWRDALWATHEAVNKGAKVFGDWLLTLRGGLDHTLADDGQRGQRKNRRILLALSWLSVEDARGAPQNENLIVTKGTDSTDARERKLRDALTGILKTRSVDDSEIGAWLDDCMPSLSAAIREDAVWVNRSAAFDAVTQQWDEQSARSDAHTLLSHLFSDKFLTLPTAQETTMREVDANEEDELEERRSAVKTSSKNAGNRTRHPFSHLLGEGKPFGKPQRKLVLRDEWHDYIKPELEAIGIPVVDPKGKSKRTKKGGGPAHTELQREMFSKAASRLAQILTKQRQQEADRLVRKQADAVLQVMEGDPSFNDALGALRTYCDEYRVTSGATGEFLIRPRQITGWDRVVNRWHSIKESDPERAHEARAEAVKSVQESDEEKKFGDANLFFRLAEDRFTKIWRHNEKADSTILERFVRGMKARSDSKRLKVAAFRHPDPYRNPIFCQFGVSRPTIHFRRLKAFTDDPAGNDPRAVGLLLWNPASNAAKLTLLYAVSQRLDREIGAACDQVQQNTEELGAVSRRGRLGAAAGGLPNADSPARVAGVFDLKRITRRAKDEEHEDTDNEGNETGKLKEPKWNGTLSANRRELEAIGKFIDKAEMQRANRRRDQLRWTLTVSMEMEGRGPWYRYIAAAPDQTPFVRNARKDKPKDKYDAANGLAVRKGDKRIESEGWPWQEFNRPLKDNTDGTALVEDTKTARGHMACLILSRLPGLRVLAVDLGHRYAAACAVWEALPLSVMKSEIKVREVVAGGMEEGDLYCHARHIDERGKERTTIYRRIGSDTLPDGSPHPAPWARLDRQFLIKLQGEDRAARKASPDEIQAVEQFEEWAGRRRTEEDSPRDMAVDALMSDTVRTARLALARHGRRARIAYHLTATVRILPGGRPQELDADGRLELLTETLADWHALASEFRWDDEPARDLWNEQLETLPGGFTIDPPTASRRIEEEQTKAQRRGAEQELRARLQPLAQLLSNDESLCRELHRAWCVRWSADDEQWKQKLKWLSRWLMPRGGSRHDPSGWHVGGLSLTRISTLTEFRRKVQVGFFTRLRPDGSRAEIGPKFGQSTLDAIQRLKDQRVKQLASRIVEAALGVGKEQDRVGKRDPKRPRRRIDDPRFAPCHAVVIENLTNYRPEETRTRRENRATMDWKSAETRKRLADHCQLYGLHLRDVNPQYTSRQDSRTGAPGVRCADVSVADFLNKPWWRKQVARAQKKAEENKGDARERLLLALEQHRSGTSEEETKKARPLRIPLAGGELFVSADPRSPLANGIQADLNAAANIGLRALLDPDFPGKWWYVPCRETDGIPLDDKVKCSACFGNDPNIFGALQKKNTPAESQGRTRRGRASSSNRTKEVVNWWRDVSAGPLLPVESGGVWLPTPAYWQGVLKRVAANLRKQYGLPNDIATDDSAAIANGES